ncbi:MAG: methyltransferase [Oscillospiraceae bacterium]|nr:methyltransferase [Oscillospiraceae bacterium]MDD3833223.1 methyltransferase [Oscillospiraceae bacterium]MDD4545812.1 methyltransferase [Oscillospiraceae bacterium]
MVLKMGAEVGFENIGGGITVEISDDYGFGEDALLLARFSSPKPDEMVCDLGTGCGIIPLVWCRSENPPTIHAVELQPKAAEMARRSAKRSGMKDRIKVYTADLRELQGVLKKESYNLVTMNPPYFAASTGGRSTNKAALLARHEGEGCTLTEVVQAAKGLLYNGGRFCLCHKPERLCEVFDILRSAGLEPKELRFVHQNPNAKPWLFLCQARKGGSPGLSVLPPFIAYDYNRKPTMEREELYGKYKE